MTIYVFDSGPLIDMFRHYYRERFPSLLILKDLWRVNNGVFNGYDLRHSTTCLRYSTRISADFLLTKYLNFSGKIQKVN